MDRILDIHIIFSDKDKKYLPNLIEQCKNFRIENSLNDWKIFIYVHDNSGEKNIGQFQKRLEIIRQTPEDHFIWFVDGDDEVINNVDLKNGDFDEVDMFSFSYQMNVFSAEEEKNTRAQIYSYQENIVIDASEHPRIWRFNKSIPLLELVGISLWSKWIKASCWKGVYEYLKNLGYENIRPNSSEDCFFVIYALKNTHQIHYNRSAPYFYHNERSYIFNEEKLIPFEKFKNFRKDHREITDAISKIDSNPSIKQFLINDYCCHLQKALSCIEIRKALNDVINEFGEDKMFKALILSNMHLRHPYVKYIVGKYLTNKETN